MSRIQVFLCCISAVYFVLVVGLLTWGLREGLMFAWVYLMGLLFGFLVRDLQRRG